MAIRDRLYIDEDRRPQFEKLKELLGKNFDNKDAFLIAMAYGFSEGVRRPLSKKWGLVLEKYLTPEDRCLITAVALECESGIPEDFNMDTAFDIAEEYARGGIGILNDRLADSVEFREGLALDLIDRLSALSDESELDQ